MTSTDMVPEGLVESEAARREVGYGKDRWKGFQRDGDLPWVRIGRSRYVRRADVAALIEREFAKSA